MKPRTRLLSPLASGLILGMLVLGGGIVGAMVYLPMPAVLLPLVTQRLEVPGGRPTVRPEWEAEQRFVAGGLQAPVLVDADRDGRLVTVTLADSTAEFDWAGDGFAEGTAWHWPGDALLAMDRNGNGHVDDAGELFGLVSPEPVQQEAQRLALPAPVSMPDLHAEDANGDGRIASDDPAYARLMLWSGNAEGGVPWEPSRLVSLACAGVRSISLIAAEVEEVRTDVTLRRIGRIDWVPRAERTGGQAPCPPPSPDGAGEPGLLATASFAVDRVNSAYRAWQDPPEDIAAMPDIRTLGTIPSLQQAMLQDAALMQAVRAFIADASPWSPARAAAVDAILFRWVGVEAMDPASRGPNIDARMLAVTERRNDRPFRNAYWGPDPRPAAAGEILDNYRLHRAYVGLRLMLQGPARDLIPGLAQPEALRQIAEDIRWDALVQRTPRHPPDARSYWRAVIGLLELKCEADGQPGQYDAQIDTALAGIAFARGHAPMKLDVIRDELRATE